jgi:hypothetical protein
MHPLATVSVVVDVSHQMMAGLKRHLANMVLTEKGKRGD